MYETGNQHRYLLRGESACKEIERKRSVSAEINEITLATPPPPKKIDKTDRRTTARWKRRGITMMRSGDGGGGVGGHGRHARG
jgi:hypothetical protein